MKYDEEILSSLKYIGGEGFINQRHLWKTTALVYPGSNQANETILLQNIVD